jgi:DNA-binding response OmpR family regulator
MGRENRQGIHVSASQDDCIVIVDDDPAYAAACKEAFGQDGRQIICFTDGAEAWRDIRSRPNLLLVVANWMLPGLDGHRICRLLVQQRPAVTTVLMVGRYFLPEAWTRKMRLRADYALAKPFSALEIKEQVRLLIATAHRRHAASVHWLPDQTSHDFADSAVSSSGGKTRPFPPGLRSQDRQEHGYIAMGRH